MQINFVKLPAEASTKREEPNAQLRRSHSSDIRFFETRYRDDFKNWKPRDTVFIIHPPDTYSNIDVPLTGRSVYMNDYAEKKLPAPRQ